MNNRFTSFGIGLILTVLLAIPSVGLAAPFAYVADSYQDWIAIIDLADNTYTTVAVGSSPQNVVLAPSGAEAYVTNYTDSTISFLDVSVPGAEDVYFTLDDASILNPEGMAISHDGSTLYVAHADPPTNPLYPYSWNTYLTEIDIASQTIVRSEAFLVNDAVNPSAIELSPDGSKIYISGRIADSLFVIDADTMTVNAQVAVGVDPRGIAISPDGARIFVTNEGSDSVTVISGSTNTVITTITVGDGPYDVVITPNGLYAYVVNSADSTVDVIDIANSYAVLTGTGYPIDVIGEAALATDPRYITTNADGTYVYVSGYGDNTVSAILTADNTIASEDVIDLANGAEAGGGMLGIAVAPEPFPWINPSTTVVTFGEQVVGGTLSQNVTISNKGLADLTLGLIADAVPLAANYSLSADNCSEMTLAYKESCSLTLDFTPTVGGPLYASFDIPSDDEDITVTISGTGGSKDGNLNPLAFSRKSFTAGTNSVELFWNKTTDPDVGDEISYRVYISKTTAFLDGVYYSVDGDGNPLALAGSGLAALLLLGGALRKRNGRMLLLASLFSAMALLSACGGGGGGGGGDGDVTVLSTTISGLDSGTNYYWKVVADDGNGGYTSTSTGLFQTK